MIEYDDYRLQSKSDLEEFLDRIPSRLQSLAHTLSDWDGNTYNFEKQNGTYDDFFLSYDLIRIIEKWVLEVTKKTKSMPREQVLELCSLLGEIVVNRSTGNWYLNENTYRDDGEEVEDRLIPSVYGWSDFVHDLPYTPLFSLEHFIRTRSFNKLESSIRYSTEQGDAQFGSTLFGKDESELIELSDDEDIEEYASNQYYVDQNSRDKATDFLDDELEFFSELLEEHDIELNTERDPFGVLENRSFYSEGVQSQIETFFHENAKGIDDVYPDDMTDMMSAYVAQYCCDYLNGYADFDRKKLVVIWSETEVKEGKLVISEILEKIENHGAGTIAEILSKCDVYSGN